MGNEPFSKPGELLLNGIILLVTGLITIPLTYYLADVNGLKDQRRKDQAEVAKEIRNAKAAEDKAKAAEDIAARLRTELVRADRLKFYREMQQHLVSTGDAFENQFADRERLYELLKSKHGPFTEPEYENIFRKYHNSFDEFEKYLCNKIKLSTKILYIHNNAIYEMSKKHSDYFHELHSSNKMSTHLEYWINKYNENINKEGTCLVYVGVEDGKPFPRSIVKEVDQKISEIEGKNGRTNTQSQG